MKRLLFFVLALCSSLNTSSIQAQSTDIVIAKSIAFQSEILNQERHIQVYLPKSYTNSPTRFPVLYVLDGQRWFLNAVNLERVFSDLELAPEFIIVGINTDTEQGNARFSFFNQNSEKLLDFLEKELIPHISRGYKTTDERMLFGWQYAGAFAIESTFLKPNLFSGYISTSPFPLAGQRLNTIAGITSEQPELDTFLYFATSINEGTVTDGAKQLDTLLQTKKPSSLRWNYQTLGYEKSSGIGHVTTPIGGMYQGLRAYYHDYSRLEFASIQDYTTAGGLNYVLDFYTKRAQRYGLENRIPDEGMFQLVRLGFDNDHYPTFNELMSHFIDNGFIETLNPNWAIRFANYYSQNNSPEGAKSIYEIMINRYPNEPTPANGLGHAHEALGNTDTAIRYYQKAIELAKKGGGHRNLPEFENDLANIEKKN